MSLKLPQQCVCPCRFKHKLYILDAMNRAKFGAVRQFYGLLLRDARARARVCVCVCVCVCVWCLLAEVPLNTSV